MGKISQLSSKYIVHATITIEGVVDRPDVVGAIFGQTEGLLGNDLELRELQRSGRIGRIEVNLDTKAGKTSGQIVIPSSLDKAETAIVAAAMEVIQRIGPCNSKIRVNSIEDIRISKRSFVVDRAKELLRSLTDNVLPDSQEIADEVAASVRMMEIVEYGKDKLPAGPYIAESEEIIIVEGRADVLNLLKNGFKNAIAINGTSIPQSIPALCSEKTVTVFVDGDRGGDLILSELFEIAEIDFVTRAPDGKEVEEITKKEIHKAIRARVTAEQAKDELGQRLQSKGRGNSRSDDRRRRGRDSRSERPERSDRRERSSSRDKPSRGGGAKKPTESEKKSFSTMLEDLIGTRGAYILDTELNILGKVPVSELQSTIKSLDTGIYAIVLDGDVESDLATAAQKAQISFIVGMGSNAGSVKDICVLTSEDLS